MKQDRGGTLRKTGKLNYMVIMPRLNQNVGDGYSFPLGVAYISASMKAAGFKVETLNLNHVEGSVAEIVSRETERRKIDVVATGGLSFQYSTIRNIIDGVKRSGRKVITIVGGGIITGDPEPAMRALEWVDYGVVGEGETTIRELCRTLECGDDPADVDGIIYKPGPRYILTRPREEIENIDLIPWPDYDGFGIDQHLQSAPPGISGLNVKNTLFMLTSRSCPYRCTFCFHTTGKKYRQRSLDSFFEELDFLVSKHDIKFICVADELFARDINRVKGFCRRIKAYGIRWCAQFRVDDVTPAMLAALKDGVCEIMSFGLESADNRVLKSMRKGTTIEQIEEALNLAHKAGMPFTGAFIFGDIEETYETASNTLKWWREHSEYQITLNLITVYPGSHLYKHALKEGIIKDPVEFLKKGCPQVNVSRLTDDEMSDIVRQFTEALTSLTKPLDSLYLDSVDYRTGRIDIRGVCSVCGEENIWRNIKMFAMNFIDCGKCGQKYNVPLPPELRANIEINTAKLLAKYEKVAVWGVNYHVLDLFKKSAVLRNENVFLIDISETKRKMNLYGKTIMEPEVVNSNDIKAVVVAIPVYFTQIESQIESNHEHVHDVIDICWLTDPDYRIS